MSTELLEREEVQAESENKHKKQRSPWLLILLVIVLILVLLSTVILGARLYKMATMDRYTVDLSLGEPDGVIELFRIQYENELGEITVQGTNGEAVVAPGTTVTYDIRLRNNEDVIIDFLMNPTVEFLTEDVVPVEFKIMDDYGNYILGSDTQWAGADGMNALFHKGSVHPGEVFTYHVTWQWVFDAGEEQDEYDTYLGNQEDAPGLSVGVTTHASGNPNPPKATNHMMHLLGEGFGCCWCCYLVWILLVACLLLLFWVRRVKKKLNEREEILEEYEEVLTANGLMVDGELVEQTYAP